MMAGAILESLMSASDCVAKITDTFFLRSVFSHWRMRAANTGSSRNSHASSRTAVLGHRQGVPRTREQIAQHGQRSRLAVHQFFHFERLHVGLRVGIIEPVMVGIPASAALSPRRIRAKEGPTGHGLPPCCNAGRTAWPSRRWPTSWRERSGQFWPADRPGLHDGDVVLAAAQAGLVDAHDLHALEALQRARLLDVELDAPPQLLVAAAQQLPAWRTGNSRHNANANASASKAAVKPKPGRAHGTKSCVVLPQAPQATRGTSACSQASYWKKSRRRHDRRNRSCTRCEAAPQAGQFSSAPWQRTSKSMRLCATSSLMSSTTQGGCKPSALVNSASTPTLNAVLPAARGPADMWTGSNAARPHAHRARPRLPDVTVVFHTKRRGTLPSP